MKEVAVLKLAPVAVLFTLSLPPTSSVAAQAPAPATLEQRIRLIEDRQAIERVLLDYGRTLDARDFAAYAALFAPTGEWQGALGVYKGPKDIQAAMEKIFTDAAADIPKGRNFHVMSNFFIDVQGDRATARSNFIFYKLEGSKPVAEVAGRYEDVLVRINGAWKFQQRTALGPG
jgi:3-phenylpropionate/cinnamic acid dioxygenase small subunit